MATFNFPKISEVVKVLQKAMDANGDVPLKFEITDLTSPNCEFANHLPIALAEDYAIAFLQPIEEKAIETKF